MSRLTPTVWIAVAIMTSGMHAAAACATERGDNTASAVVAVSNATEFSSRHRLRYDRAYRPRDHHRVVLTPRFGAYYARPLWYRSAGIAPLFPFEPGHGRGPSW
jgi:hypothetical protein